MRLGPMILAAVLLGVPRAFGAGALGGQRSVYIDMAPLPPELTDFTEELERALAESPGAQATRRSEATTVVDVLNVARSASSTGQPMEAVTLVVRQGNAARRMVLHYAPERRGRATMHLLEQLSA